MNRFKRWWIDGKQDDGIDIAIIALCAVGVCILYVMVTAE